MTENEILFKEIGIKKLLGFRSFHEAVLPLVRGFYVSRCLEALDIVGCIDVFRQKGHINLSESSSYPAAKNCDITVLKQVCDYLYEVGIFTKSKDEYGLTKVGKRVCLPRHGLFHFVQAYGPIFYELPDIIMGKKRYGADVQRIDRYVAKATAEVSEWVPLPAVRRIIRVHKFQNVLDLGCGRGELLLSISNSQSILTLRGVDIARDSIADGNDAISKAGQADRIALRVGDITRPEEFTDWLKAADVVTIMFVLHEFLKQGEAHVVQFLKKLREFAGSNTHFLIAETPRHDPTQIRKHPTAVAEHHLFHYLSNQGIIGTDQLRSLIRQAGMKIVEDLHIKTFSQHYVLAK